MESSIPPALTSICYVRLVLYCLRRLASGHARVFRIWRRTTLGFLSFPSQQHFTPARCPCLGWSHHASMCLPVCPLVRVSFLFSFSISHTFFLFSEFGFSLISKSAGLLSRDQMPLSWVVPLRFICLNVFACLSACQGIFILSFSISHTFLCFLDLGFPS